MQDAFSDPQVKSIIFMKSSRSGGTQVMNNAVGYCISEDPGPVMMLRPDDRRARKWSKVDFTSMVRDTPILRERVITNEQKIRKNEMLLKQFLGGLMYVVGAQSPVGLSDVTVRYLFADEVDRYKDSVGGDENGEGDPVELAITRTTTVWNKKIMITSTPTTRGHSRIERLFLATDRRLYYVPCVHCGAMQVLVFSPKSQLVQWLSEVGKAHEAQGFLAYDTEHSVPRWARYVCGSCGKEMAEGHKHIMLRHGDWRPMYPDVIEQRGFHISELYSPFTTWKETAEIFARSKGRRSTLRVFINTRMGESFEEEQTMLIAEHELMARREDYTKVPDGVVFLVVGVDTQDDWFEATTWGVGIGEEYWFIERHIVPGNPAYDSTRDLLWATIYKPYEHECGYIAQPGQLGGVMAVGIDSRGHKTKPVYDFVAKHKGSRVFALAGVEGFGKQFLVKRSKNRKVTVQLHLVGTDAANEDLFDKLQTADSEGKALKSGPGVMHFNMKCDAEFFEQLTNAKRKPKQQKNGVTKMQWVKRDENKRDEVKDTTIYAMAANAILGAPMIRAKKMLQRTIERWKESQTRKNDDSHNNPAPAPVQPANKRRFTVTVKV